MFEKVNEWSVLLKQIFNTLAKDLEKKENNERGF